MAAGDSQADIQLDKFQQSGHCPAPSVPYRAYWFTNVVFYNH